MDVFSSHCNNLAVLVERSSFNASSSNGHRSLCSFLFCSSLLRPMGGFSLLRAHCAFRKQIQAVLGIERGHGAAFESFVKTVAAQLLRRCSEAEVEAVGSGHGLPDWCTPEALSLFQLGLLHS